jgi:hypothetical protein
MSSSRQRKRMELRKRKARSAERAETASEGEVEPGESFQERMSRRSEAKNQAVRDTLEPLAEGERPGPVTVAAIVSAVLALALTVSAGLAFAGVEIRGETPRAVPILLFAIVIWAMTWGLWKARYWAVLGFQAMLVLLMLSAGLGLLTVGNIAQALGTVAILGLSATLFYFMIRAMARIQMPERRVRPADGSDA